MVEQAREHLKGVPKTALHHTLRRVEKARKELQPRIKYRIAFDDLITQIPDLRLATLGEERAAVLSDADGKRSPVELY